MESCSKCSSKAWGCISRGPNTWALKQAVRLNGPPRKVTNYTSSGATFRAKEALKKMRASRSLWRGRNAEVRCSSLWRKPSTTDIENLLHYNRFNCNVCFRMLAYDQERRSKRKRNGSTNAEVMQGTSASITLQMRQRDQEGHQSWNNQRQAARKV